MDKAGRIVIPKGVRERIGAGEGAQFDLDLILDRIELTLEKPAAPAPKLVEEDGICVIVKTGQPSVSITKALQEDRENRNFHLLGE